MKANPVVHFEMPYEDPKRMTDFYANTFGWESNQMGPEMGNYVVAMSGESDKNGPLKPGYINGGFWNKKDNPSYPYPSFVISVDDIEVAMKKISDNGGKLIGEPTDIPGVGKFISFTDTEGNRCSILQPIMPK